MKILYIFPHPDDESFGPAAAISRQRRAGHEVHLLTLTRGGATSLRHKHGLSVGKMGAVRLAEMKQMAKVLDLSGLTVLDLPDSGLKGLDPREIERVLGEQIVKIRPAVLVTYPVHGISGFHDHLVAHAVVKREYLELKSAGAAYLKRLAFYTLDKATAKSNPGIHTLSWSKAEEIGCALKVDERDIAAFNRALDCYETYGEMIEKTGIRNFKGPVVNFEIFQERHRPPLDDLCRFV